MQAPMTLIKQGNATVHMPTTDFVFKSYVKHSNIPTFYRNNLATMESQYRYWVENNILPLIKATKHNDIYCSVCASQLFAMDKEIRTVEEWVEELADMFMQHSIRTPIIHGSEGKRFLLSWNMLSLEIEKWIK